jgi:metal-responsive CopG/Arc/MetJ family transcriptional regulator
MRSHRKLKSESETPSALRASVTFPATLYHALESLAREKRVSLAWVVRDAAERYVSKQRKPEAKRGLLR